MKKTFNKSISKVKELAHELIIKMKIEQEMAIYNGPINTILDYRKKVEEKHRSK